MNSKNQLQEYCQHHKLELPIYETINIAIIDNKCLWQTTVSIPKTNYKIKGESFYRKVDAEMNAASILYLYINQDFRPQMSTYQIPSDIDVYCLIDLESIQQCRDLIYPKNWYVVGVMSDCCPLYSKIEEIKQRMLVNVIKSPIKDAADHYLTFLCAKIPENLKEKPILIVSKDHYASCLPTILNGEGFAMVRHIKSINELSEFISLSTE